VLLHLRDPSVTRAELFLSSPPSSLLEEAVRCQWLPTVLVTVTIFFFFEFSAVSDPAQPWTSLLPLALKHRLPVLAVACTAFPSSPLLPCLFAYLQADQVEPLPPPPSNPTLFDLRSILVRLAASGGKALFRLQKTFALWTPHIPALVLFRVLLSFLENLPGIIEYLQVLPAGSQ
jgi:hypothetical protein